MRFQFFPGFLAIALLFPALSRSQAKPPVSGSQPNRAEPSPTHSQEAVADQVNEAETAIAGTDWKTAEAKLDSWLVAHPNDARALFDAGYVADVQDRAQDAETLYRRSIDVNGNTFDPHLLLGLLFARQGKSEDARSELKRATQLDPGESGPELKARAWRALARLDQGSDSATASNDLLEALKLSQETTDDMLLAADIASKNGQLNEAETEYRRVLAKAPDSEPANAGLAHVLIKKKELPEAELLLRNALEHAPNDTALTAQLAGVLAAEDKAEALPLFQKLHAIHPEDVTITRMLAEVLADAGDVATSDEMYTKLLTSSPNDVGLLVGHGQNLVRQAKYVSAYATFEKATQIDPENGDGWSGLAFAASRTNKPEVTLHALTMRSRYLPESPSTFFLWATAYDSLHEKAQAATYYHHFLNAAAGKFPNQEWQARERLKVLEK